MASPTFALKGKHVPRIFLINLCCVARQPEACVSQPSAGNLFGEDMETGCQMHSSALKSKGFFLKRDWG
jgi:hypothetical protein